MTKQRIKFYRDELALIGNLFLPDNFDADKKYKAIIVQGSATSVKEQMPETYAIKLREYGFVVLAFDYSHYGESEGKPRHLENPNEKLIDLKAAVGYLNTLPYVKNVSMVGICTSGGNAAYLAAEDNQVSAIATVAGFLPEPSLLIDLFGEEKVTLRYKAAEAAKSKFLETSKETNVTAYSEVDATAANYVPREGAYDYYLNEKRGGVSQWKNELSVMSWETFQKFDPIAKASEIKIPTIIIHSEGCAFPAQAKKFYSKLNCEKEIVWGSGNHFDYYDHQEQVDFAVQNIVRFFNEKLTIHE